MSNSVTAFRVMPVKAEMGTSTCCQAAVTPPGRQELKATAAVAPPAVVRHTFNPVSVALGSSMENDREEAAERFLAPRAAQLKPMPPYQAFAGQFSVISRPAARPQQAAAAFSVTDEVPGADQA